MYCATCDRWEYSNLGVDTETCMKCGGYLCTPEDQDDWQHGGEEAFPGSDEEAS